MVPTPNDPKWRDFVMGQTKFELKDLGTKMLVTRLRLRTIKKDEASLRDAIREAHEYFTKNEKQLAHDLVAIFGGK